LKIVKDNQVLLMNPIIAQAVKCLQDIDFILKNLNMLESKHILIPVNDSPAVDKPGGSGSHWSLLVYVSAQKKFLYFDTAGSTNHTHALKIANSLHNYLQNKGPLDLSTVSVPKQLNAYDCGIYVLMYVDVIVQLILQERPYDAWKLLLPDITEADLLTKRGQLAMLCNVTHLNLTADMMNTLMVKPGKNCKVTPVADVAGERKKSAICNDVSPKHTNFKGGNHNNKQSKWIPITLKNGVSASINKGQSMNGKQQVTLSNRFETLSEEAEPLNDNHGKTSPLKNHIKTSPKKSSAKRSEAHVPNRNHKHTNKNQKRTSILNVTFCSDSQGRDVQAKIESLSNNKIKAFGYVRPNASLIQVIDSSNIEPENPVIIMGGTNDYLDKNFHNIFSDLENRLDDLSKKRTVFITTIPRRYDRSCSANDDLELAWINNYIRHMVIRKQNVHLISLEGLERHHFTRHGLHLNNTGKTKLAQLIINTLNWKYNLAKINIVESHMEKTINMFQKNKNVGFAHCISADIESERQMSAGVAVIFRKHFGRPTREDFLDKHLTCQVAEGGATVYGLVTKAKFNEKPMLEDYDKAFQQLTIDFKQKKLDKLICSPMGCIRDRVPLNRFINNLVKFQEDTKASITIVINEEKQRQYYYSKNTFKPFKLRDQLNKELSNAMLRVNQVGSSMTSSSHVKPSSSSALPDPAMPATVLPSSTMLPSLPELHTSSVSGPHPSTAHRDVPSLPSKCVVSVPDSESLSKLSQSQVWQNSSVHSGVAMGSQSVTNGGKSDSCNVNDTVIPPASLNCLGVMEKIPT
jgi:hypothetical protein